jgi:integral membrane protein (TIGR00529 family)
LLAALWLILMLADVLRTTRILPRMVDALRGLVRDPRLIMAAVPAFIGFLPSPGGAVFSAPMVGDAAQGLNATPERLSFINYWYRHVWEFVLPLYVSVLMAAEIAGHTAADLIALNWPFTLVMILAGAPLAFHGLQVARAQESSFLERRQVAHDLLAGIMPIAVVIVLVMGFKADIALALLLVVDVLLVVKRYSLGDIVALVRRSFSIQILGLVLGVMVFKEMLAASGAVAALPPFFAGLGVPTALVFLALPFVVGVLTGNMLATVGVTMPVLIGLIDPATHLPLVAFGFICGFAGVILSPVHLCLVLTVQHFGAQMGRIYWRLVVGEAVVVGTAALWLLRS